MAKRSNWIVWVAKRYLKSKRDHRFLNLSTTLSMGGVGLGVAAIIIVLSVMSGFENQLREKLVSTDLHVLIHPLPRMESFDLGTVQTTELESLPVFAGMKNDSQVKFISPMLSSEVVLRVGTKVSGVMVKGVSPEKVKRIEPKLVEKALPQMLVDRSGSNTTRFHGLWVGRELSYELGLIPGDFVTLISPSHMDGPFSNIPRMRRFVIEGIYQTGVPDQEAHLVFTRMNSMESFLRQRNVVSEIEVTLNDSRDSSDFASRYREQTQDLRIQDWNELNSSLFASMKLERIAMFLILLFTVMIASLNIVSTLTLTIQEKLKEIAILKTLGATEKNIAHIFLWKGLLVGGVGVLWGTLGAWAICIALKRFQFISLPEFYYDRTLPVSFDPLYFFGVPVISFGIVLLACHFPAKRASTIDPVNGIRGQ